MSTTLSNPYTPGSYLYRLVEEALTGDPQPLEPQAESWPDEQWTLPGEPQEPQDATPAEIVLRLAQRLAGEPQSGSRLDRVKAELRGLDALRRIVDDRRRVVVQTVAKITGARRLPR